MFSIMVLILSLIPNIINTKCTIVNIYNSSECGYDISLVFVDLGQFLDLLSFKITNIWATTSQTFHIILSI